MLEEDEVMTTLTQTKHLSKLYVTADEDGSRYDDGIAFNP